MKLSHIALLATAGSIVAAQPHRHQHFHRHVEKRSPVVDVVTVPGPTVIAYVLDDGTPISEDDVQEGIKNGTLVWATGSLSSTTVATSTPVPVPSQTPTQTPTQTPDVGAAFYQQPASSAESTSPTSSSAPSSGSSYTPPSGQGLDSDFPDGQLDCSTFPSQYGAVAVPWENIGGWSGIQYPTYSSDGSQIVSISTAVAGMSCTEGAMCSYACPPGYEKSQWPTIQGSTGQSVGGITCKGGKLYLTNAALSTKLCIAGVGNVQVQNTLSQQVSVCRTDYPGEFL
jgi:SUN family beta-glucosidase